MINIFNNNYEKLKQELIFDIFNNENMNILYIFEEEEYFKIINNILDVMEEFITENIKIMSEENFNEIFTENIEELIFVHYNFFFFDIYKNACKDKPKNKSDYATPLLLKEYIKEDKTNINTDNVNTIQKPCELGLLSHSNEYDIENEEKELFEEEILNIIHISKKIFFKYFVPFRSCQQRSAVPLLNKPDIELIKRKLDYLMNVPQPIQKSIEWYNLRNNMLTASNIYKVFENQNIQNQLIYEKCDSYNMQRKHKHSLDSLSCVFDKDAPKIDNMILSELYTAENGEEFMTKNTDKKTIINVENTLHWGNKYEPLSILIYELLYNTTIQAFGCIQHKDYYFIGASPDGINNDEKKIKYGRMLEIKNIVNREINGIPKKEYWIQMQIQMEVCDLDECDFLETKFVEFDNEKDFFDNNLGLYKGIILYFINDKKEPFYKYFIYDIDFTNENLDSLIETYIDKYEKNYNYNWISIIYWNLEQISCVLVERNKLWFKSVINELTQFWNLIERERINGYEHRKPNKKNKKNINNINKCLLTNRVV